MHFFSKKRKKVLDKNENRVYSKSKGGGTLCLKLKKERKIVMNKYLKYAMMSLAVAVVFVATGASASGNVFSTVLSRMLTTFRNARSVIFVVGGFGLIGLGFAAIFGKVNWKWLAALACGLAIVAVAGQVVDYVTRQDVGKHANDVLGTAYGDTLSDNTTGYSSQASGGTTQVQWNTY